MSTTAAFFNDVPKELIQLLNEIKFTALSPEQGRTMLNQLKELVSNITEIQPRRVQSPATTYQFKQPIPQEVVTTINSYDFSNVGKLKIKMAVPFVRAQLKKRGLL